MKDPIITTGDESTSKRTTKLILVGTLIATSLLLVLLLSFNITDHSVWFGDHAWIAIVAVVYLFIGLALLSRGFQLIANWMLVIFYELLAFFTLLMWGLNAPVGILTISFAIILPSILMRSRSIFPVAGITVLTLITVQVIHITGKVEPNIELLSHPSTFWDVLTYSFILAIFALVSWVSGNQREKNLNRTLLAESELQLQKDLLSIELEKESAALRLTQLNQMRELHKFAILGQSAAATLHELSNHLSVLNIDIDDLHLQHHNSEAIANAKESIEHINKTVRQARFQLNSYDQNESFNALTAINQIIKDMRQKFAQRRVTLVRVSKLSKRSFPLKGSHMALMQIVTIVLNNALDACYDSPNPKVIITLKQIKNRLVVSIVDNGPGIGSSQYPLLFKPIISTKSAGMGVGLFIAQHLIKEQFNGEIKFVPIKYGAQFDITISNERLHGHS